MRLASRPPLARIAYIDEAVRAGRHPNARILARELEVHPRTIERDLQFLRDRLLAPLVFDAVRNGFRYAEPNFRLPFVSMSEGELLALFLADRLLREYGQSPYAEPLARAFAKLTAALPETVSIDPTHLAQAYTFRHQKIDPGDAERFLQLNRAVREGRQLELVYWSASSDAETRRRVDPYHLASLGGDWYLVGFCHLRQEVRMFVPTRIRALSETGQPSVRPTDFRIADYLDAGFHAVRGNGAPTTVRLRFRPAAARYVRERLWHPSQQLAEQADGGLELTLSLTHLLEVKRWTLSFGPDCEVLEPPELREEIRLVTEETNRMYRNA